MNQNKKGLFLAVLANIIWGSTFLASSIALKSMGPFSLIFFRFLFAALALFFFAKVTSRKIKFPIDNKTSLLILANSIVSFVMIYSFQMMGLEFLSTSLSASIMLLAPLIVVFISNILNVEIELKNIVGIALGVVGGLLLIYDKGYGVSVTSSAELKGVIYTFMAAFFLAASSFLSKKISVRIDALNTTFWSIFGALPILCALSFYEQVETPIAFDSDLLICILYLSIVCSAFAFFIWNKALQITTPSYVASTMHLKTPVAIFFGVLIGNESFNINYIYGTIIITLGIVITKRTRLLPLFMHRYLEPIFAPEVLIETTNVCNKKCKGCYAANIYNQAFNESNFLNVETFEAAIAKVPLTVKSIAIRGGEPTLNKKLPEIIAIASNKFDEIFLETNGEWLLEGREFNKLFKSCKNHNVTIKISFDTMHGLAPEKLNLMVTKLENFNIKYLVAITEKNKYDFLNFIKSIPFVKLDKIYFQQFATSISEVMMESCIGVINYSGGYVTQVNSRFKK
jgi:drug/metabolite transporter (DMT)-like permease/organic radical activating enzyme